jgi:hypothetical protein
MLLTLLLILDPFIPFKRQMLHKTEFRIFLVVNSFECLKVKNRSPLIYFSIFGHALLCFRMYILDSFYMLINFGSRWHLSQVMLPTHIYWFTTYYGTYISPFVFAISVVAAACTAGRVFGRVWNLQNSTAHWNVYPFTNWSCERVSFYQLAYFKDLDYFGLQI